MPVLPGRASGSTPGAECVTMQRCAGTAGCAVHVDLHPGRSPIMPQTVEGQLSPEVVLAEMMKNGVTHVVWLPDSETNFLYQLMQAEPSLRLVPVSREGLAFSVAAGLSAGGQTPI